MLSKYCVVVPSGQAILVFAVHVVLTVPALVPGCSAGMLLLQLAVPQLRSGSAIRNLNLELEAVAFDLKTWRYAMFLLKVVCCKGCRPATSVSTARAQRSEHSSID